MKLLLFLWNCFILLSQMELIHATLSTAHNSAKTQGYHPKSPHRGKIINLQPTNDHLFFWDIQYYQDLQICQNDKVRFYTAWGLHNLFLGRSTPTTDRQARTCDTDAMENSANWKGVFCACPNGEADGCQDVSHSNAVTHNFQAPNCSDPALNLTAQTIPGLGTIYLGFFDFQFKERGTFWAVCTVGSHCQSGMKVKIHVGPPGRRVSVHSLLPSSDPNKLSQWAFFDYPTLRVNKLDTIRFRFFENFHGILTSPVTHQASDFPLEVGPARIARCNQAGFKWWKGVPDAPEGSMGDETYRWITYDLKVSDVMGNQSVGSFDVICSAGGPSKLPRSPTDTFGHIHCVVGGQGFNVIVS